VSEQSVVTVQGVHLGEVRVANTDDDNGDGKGGGLDDCRLGGLDVSNDPIRDDEEDEVLAGISLVGGGKPGHMIDHWREVCGAIELDCLERLVVSRQDPLYSLTEGRAGTEVEKNS